MKKGILFDLDGTLWDSSLAVADSFNIALERLGYQKHLTKEDMQSVMGKVMDEIAHIFFDDISKEKAYDIMVYCTEVENEYLKTHGGELYPELEATLKALKADGFFIGCVSNCQSGYIEAFLESSGLNEYFDDIECWGNTLMPKSYNIRLTSERNGLDKTVYVGDTLGDYNSACDAGVPFIHASYGFGSVPEGTPSVSKISELPEFLKSFGL